MSMSSLKYTNKHDISAALAVFLLHDDYEYDSRPNSVSATSLLKPLRQLVLIHQNKQMGKEVDISDLAASRMGSALHDGCEKAWNDPKTLEKAMDLWGFPQAVRNKVKINPPSVKEGDIPIYVEQRYEKELNGWIITGKYDLVMDGVLNDYKSTSTWTYIYDSNADNYTKQGSIYKWLVPDQIKSPYININFLFTDWSKVKAMQDGSYPQLRVHTKKYPLMEPAEIEAWMIDKLAQLDAHKNNPQEMLPLCTDEELWATETVYKYFKNPAKKSRATKNFKTLDEALIRKTDDGNVGEIVEVPGQVKACRYCPAVNICKQAEDLLASGRLLL